MGKISNVVKSELLERLHEGVYEGIYNFPRKTFLNVMAEKGRDDENEEDQETESEDEKELMKELHAKKSKESTEQFIAEDEEAEESEAEVEEAQREYEDERSGGQLQTQSVLGKRRGGRGKGGHRSKRQRVQMSYD